MPVTAIHSGYQLSILLQRLFQQQARDIAQRLTPAVLDGGKLPDTAYWNEAIAETVKPLMLQQWQAGMVQSARRIAALRAGRKPHHEDQPRRVALHPEHTFGPTKGVMSYAADNLQLPVRQVRTVRDEWVRACLLSAFHQVTRAGSGEDGQTITTRSRASYGWQQNRPFYSYRRKALGASFDLFSPRVLDAVDAATMQFCRETNDTATTDLKDAIKKLRALLKRGLERGEAFRLLSRRVRQLFADPRRAYRIALTESVRAMQHGALMNAKESGVVKKKQWLASAASCDLCQEMEEKGEIDLDKPFQDDGTRPYGRIMVPPLHPHCICSWTEVL